MFTEHKKTWSLWLIYLIAIAILITVSNNSNTVTHSYFQAALNWFAGKNLYNGIGTDFIYFPQSAILYFPLTLFSFPVSEVIWRIISLSVYSLGVYGFAALANQKRLGHYFFVMTIVCLPIIFSSLRNGQMNLMLAGLTLLAITAIKDNQFWRAAFLLSLSLALKPTAIVILLLSFVLFSGLRIRLCLCLLIFALLPFATQTPAYVISQYQAAMHMLTTSANLGTHQSSWAQLFGLLAMFNLQVSANWQYILRITAALLTLTLCGYAYKKLPLNSAIFYLYALSASYLMLFNPRTENNDYAILAPAIGFALTYLFFVKQRIAAGALVLSVIAITCGYYIGHTFTPGHVSWVNPLMAVLFATLMIMGLFFKPLSIVVIDRP